MSGITISWGSRRGIDIVVGPSTLQHERKALVPVRADAQLTAQERQLLYGWQKEPFIIRTLLFTAVMSAASCVFADDSPTLAAEQRPGYGVVESITRVSAPPAEESASAGSSAPSRPRISYLVRVKLDDSSVQIRQLRKRSVAVGERVLITNAGDVLPE